MSSNSDTNTDTDTDTASGSGTGSGSDTATDTATDTDTDTNTDQEVELRLRHRIRDIASGSGSGSGSDTATATDTDTDADADLDQGVDLRQLPQIHQQQQQQKLDDDNETDTDADTNTEEQNATADRIVELIKSRYTSKLQAAAEAKLAKKPRKRKSAPTVETETPKKQQRKKRKLDDQVEVENQPERAINLADINDEFPRRPMLFPPFEFQLEHAAVAAPAVTIATIVNLNTHWHLQPRVRKLINGRLLMLSQWMCSGRNELTNESDPNQLLTMQDQGSDSEIEYYRTFLKAKSHDAPRPLPPRKPFRPNNLEEVARRIKVNEDLMLEEIERMELSHFTAIRDSRKSNIKKG